MRTLPISRDIYRLRTLIPTKTAEFFSALRYELDFDFRAAKASSVWTNMEEIRAEHLYRADRVKQRLRSGLKENALINLLNQRLFGESLDTESSYVP